jgi:diguanylate cyclase (GGDEF)-like protein/PAS domain S-box-containing protein
MRQLATILSLVAASAVAASLARRFVSPREGEHPVHSIIDALPNPIYFKQEDGRYAAVNSAWESFFSVPRGAVIGRSAQEVRLRERTIIEAPGASDQTIRRRSGFRVYADAIPLPDGSRRDVIICESSCVSADGRVRGLLSSIMDITDQKRAERRMMMEHAVTRVLAEAESLDEIVPTIIETICKTMGWHYGALYRCHRDEGVLRCEEMWGVNTAEIREFMAAVGRRSVPTDEPGDGLVRRTFRLGKPVWIPDITTDETLRRKSLVIKAGLHGALAFPLRGGGEVLGILEFFHTDVLRPDAMLLAIAESIGSQIGQFIVRRRTEAEKYAAMHDALTGLPSRLLFMERLEHALVQAGRHGRRLAVMFIDLDRFKFINDSLGHEAGDMMLQEIARRLKLRLREGDTVARLGGDEFVMLLEEITSPQDTLLIAQKLVSELGEPFLLSGQHVNVTASIGVSTYPEDSIDASTMLRYADAAMYQAKAKGRNVCELYSDRSLSLAR